MNPAAKALLAALDALPERVGSPWERLLADIGRYRDTEFGKAHDFASIRSEKDFRERVPVSDYDECSSWITRVAEGERNVLPCGGVLAFERTSGTSSGAKLIPVTEALREDFAYGMAAWFHGWRKRCPEVFAGKAYWAISPPGMAHGRTPGGLQVGLEGDGAYFPDEIGAMLAGWLVVPELSGGASEVFAETAEALLRTPDLSLVSVWSPTFLLCIDAEIARLRPGKTWREIWPGLALVSCWADASSARWIQQLEKRLGGIPIEPKGLLATEGVTSIPSGNAGAARLAHECHYHEFLDDDGSHLPHQQLGIGMECEVLLSTSGGLMRYRSGDRVKISGVTDLGFPEMKFIGRGGSVSDMVGEKLAEDSVTKAFTQVGACGLLAADPDRLCYELWVEDSDHIAPISAQLLENPYFRQALALGQLAPTEARILKDDWVRDLSTAIALRNGSRIGDVKLPVLFRQDGSGEVEEWLG